VIVTATCKAKCWDSERCVMYQPGETVELDSESPLAALTIDPQEPGRPTKYIFEFPRISAIAAAAQTHGRAESPQEAKG